MEDFIFACLIGEGSFGKVYKATEKSSQNTVALKILSKRGRSSKDVQLLRRECEIQKDLKHPNIINLLRTFETDSEIVFVTEFATSDLHSLLARESSLGEERTRLLAFDLISALYYLHSHRILHRDLKPQNILLDSENHAKLCDFGLARNMTMSTHVLTSIKGTPLYMSPELLDGKPYDHMADLWSLGCIIYEALAGEPPFYTTSIIHLAKLIRNGRIKWPSFLSPECYSFLDSLLVIDPTQRISWPQILSHPFIEGNILVLEEDTPVSPFTHPMSDEERLAKERQAAQLMGGQPVSRLPILEMQNLSIEVRADRDENVTSSRDSINAILQSDVEHIETDVEDVGTRKNRVLVSGNTNLVMGYLNDNFPHLSISSKSISNSVNESTRQRTNQVVERRKLNQNLDNFSVRLGNPMDGPGSSKQDLDSTKKIKAEIEGTNKMTPTMLSSAWETCEDAQNPPIENEEWLVFIRKTMQEILDGDLESLKQQNFVSILVAPLRNSKASPRVIESVAQLFMLPLVVDGPTSVVYDIKTIYAEVKLVPNLIYATKLLCRTPLTSSSQSPTGATFRPISSLTPEELKTLSCIYELVCHLIHTPSNGSFLDQFCDAVALLGVDELVFNILGPCEKVPKRIKANVLALLACILRDSPENADLVESIVFDSAKRVDLEELLKERNSLCRLRALMLIRLLGRYCCVALQKNWSAAIRELVKDLAHDEDLRIRTEATDVLMEFKNLHFFD